jgi:hypothetical protein
MLRARSWIKSALHLAICLAIRVVSSSEVQILTQSEVVWLALLLGQAAVSILISASDPALTQRKIAYTLTKEQNDVYQQDVWL